jgi:polyisoprenoid-binding protein YceI
VKWMLGLIVVAACKQTAAPPPPATPVDHSGDRIVVLAHHIQKKPTDPVVVELRKFHVVRAHFDPAHLEGGTATIELDLASLHTDSDERDDDLRSPNFLDVGKLATATIEIDHVHARAGASYAADATVGIHGVTKTFPVEFEVVKTAGRAITIKGEHAFSRLDFGIGSDPAQDPRQQVALDLTIQLALTLESS